MQESPSPDEFGLIQPFVLTDRISYLRAGGFENDRTAIVFPGRAPQTFNGEGGGYRYRLREDRWETAVGKL